MFRSTSEFDKQLEKATSHLLLEPDWQSIIEICDIICQGECQPKYAISAIKKRFSNANPYVALYGLYVLESVVKNCGAPIHDEVATKSFMEELREMVHATNNEKVRSKILELIQTWTFAFRNVPKYRIISESLSILKTEGYPFPALRESDAMFTADRAPSWIDGDNCYRCRTQFTLVIRKHHCRACGQVFCSKCTSRSCTLPKFGIEKEVRVCEDCYNKHNSADGRGSAGGKDDLESPAPGGGVKSSASSASEASKAASDKIRQKEEELKLQEEEELQLALALSRSEAEHKEKERSSRAAASSSAAAAAAAANRSFTSPVKENSGVGGVGVKMAEMEDPELARYLNRSYWEQRQQAVDKELLRPDAESLLHQQPLHQPSAPVTIVAAAAAANNSASVVSKVSLEKYQNGGGESSDEVDDFCATLSGQLDMFVNRMKSNSSRGRSIANDSSVQTLFLNITAMHSRLMQYIHHQEEARVYYEGLQDKLTQAKDARAALDALREEHSERVRREAEEAERQRQIQMAHKLEIMRKKKQEYLQYQRQLAMQRMQDEEREMQMRIEQQKHMYLRGQQQMPQQQQGPAAMSHVVAPPPPSHPHPGMAGGGGYPLPPHMAPPQPPGHAPQYMGGGGQPLIAPSFGREPAPIGYHQGPVYPAGPGAPYAPHAPYSAYPGMAPHQGVMYAPPHPPAQQQQPASAPAVHYAPQMMMPVPPQQQQQQSIPQAGQQQQQPAQVVEAQAPAVAELISFD